MSSRMSVKVPVKKVITQLDTRKKEILADKEKENAAATKHEAAVVAWEQRVKDVVGLNPQLITELDCSGTYRPGVGYLKDQVTFTIPLKSLKVGAYPENKFEAKFRHYDGCAAEIDQMLRVLKMTDDEYVNATTLKSVSQYL